MADLMDLLKDQMSGAVLGQLSDQLGIGDRQQTASATNAIFSVLTNALSKNVSSRNGAGALAGALDRDHDGSILDDLGSMLLNSSIRRDRSSDGVGILGHILGSNQNLAIDAVMRMTGLDKNKTASLMVKLAPMIMGVLGRQKRQRGYTNNQLSDFLQKSANQHNRNNPATDLITRVLDQDGDGSMYDELASMGLKALGNFFSK